MPVWQALLAAALGALGFFLPFSPAGVAVSMAILFALLLVRPGLMRQSAPWKEPVLAVGLALLAYIVAHTVWTTGLTERSWDAINRYHELLFAPVLFALMSEGRHRLIFMRALFAGAVLLALAHWVALLVPGLAPMLESRRISAGFALAVCAFVALVRASGGQARPWPARALSAFLALTVLLTIEGRTGHVVVTVLLSCAAWLHSPPRWRWVAAVASPLLILAFAMNSDAMHSRIKETLAGTQPVGPDGELSSTGIRIELLRVASDLARRHAAVGAGFANYPAAHQEAARAMNSPPGSAAAYVQAHWPVVSNPHNEYLMQLISGGVVALTLFLAWLGLTFREALRAPPPLAGMLGGMGLAFAVGSLFNSLLMDFVEAHFYVALLTCLLAERRDVHRQDGRADHDRILVVATRQIGDVLLTTPLIREARRRWPQARIEVLGFAGTLGMLRGNPDVDDLIEVPARLGWSGLRSLVPRLWRRYQLALVTDPGDRAHLLGWVAAERRSGIVPETSTSNWWKKLLLDHVVVAAGDQGTVHAAAEKQSLLAPWLNLDSAAPEVVGPAATALPPQVQSQIRPNAVVVHAPSMWPYKQWPLAHFEVLLKGLLARGHQVILTGSASPRDKECIAPLRGLAEPPQLLDLSGQLDFNQLATLLREAALYIGPDTSVSHLAAATGVPVIAILGPTNPMRWAPWPARAATQEIFVRSARTQQAGNVTVLQSSLPCVPCGRAGCEDHRQSRSDCLEDIKPERVLEEAAKILA